MNTDLQCQGEHRVGEYIFYCVRPMGHAGEHCDIADRRWKRLFIAPAHNGHPRCLQECPLAMVE